MFKSTDAGASWIEINNGLTNLEVLTVAVDSKSSGTLYAGTSGGVFKSTNSGKSWMPSLAGTLAQTVVIDPTNNSVVYSGISGSDGGMVAKTINGGLSWSSVRIPFSRPGLAIRALAIDPANPSTLYAASTIQDNPFDVVVRSVDGGRTWTNLGLVVTGIRLLVIDQRAPSTIYASTEEGMYKTTDGGSNWFEIILGGDIVALVIDPEDSSVLYASIAFGQTEGVFKSTDGGITWNPTGLTGIAGGPLAIDPRDPANLYAAGRVTTDTFVARLNATGSTLFYSTYLGGMSDDGILGMSMALDRDGSVYIAGTTRSKNFPTVNALRPRFGSGFNDAYVAKLEPPQNRAAPLITRAEVSGKKLLVFGQNFSDGAVVLVDDVPQKTRTDESNPNSALIGKKAAKKIARGSAVTIKVMNSDGALSEPFTFVRPLE